MGSAASSSVGVATYVSPMCNAYNLRHRNEAILDIARAMQLSLTDLPEFPATGDVADTYTVIITDANAAMRVHDRMPVILAPDAARRWIEPGPLPAELLVPYPAEEMQAWRVGDAAKNSRIEPHAGMAVR